MVRAGGMSVWAGSMLGWQGMYHGGRGGYTDGVHGSAMGGLETCWWHWGGLRAQVWDRWQPGAAVAWRG